MFTYATKLAFT